MNNIEKAELIATWICVNQYVSHPDWEAKPYQNFDMNEDMNFGRFVRNYSISQEKILHLSTNWISGMTIYGLMMLYDFNKKQNYLDASMKGAFYLKALQNTMDENPEYQGAINERITSNRWCAPRDALSAAWGFLRIYHSIKDVEFLKRAELYATWHMTYAMKEFGYPIAYYFFDQQEPKQWLGNFQCGSALFYYDLYNVTGHEKYKETAVKIADFYIQHFIRDDGSPIVSLDTVGDSLEPIIEDTPWSEMHQFNDDFSSLALLGVYQMTGDRKYLDKVIQYMDWVCDLSHGQSGLGKYKLSVSSCVVSLNCLNLYLLTNDSKYLNVGKQSLMHLEESLIIVPDKPAIHGGILGMEVSEVKENNDVLSLRVGMYAIYTFLLYGLYDEFIKSDKKHELPEQLINNPMFIGNWLLKS